VDDKITQELMGDSYYKLWDKDGISPLAARHQAQLAILHTEGGHRGLDQPNNSPLARLPPYYWAAFVLSGDWR
jgi:CHAT domain-containing protein